VKDGDVSSTTVVEGGSVAPSKSLGGSPAVALSRSNSSPTRKCPGGVNSSGGTCRPSVDANSEGNPSTTRGSMELINDSPYRYSKTLLNENLTVAPRAEAMLEEGLG
jgi:hypothetical protein